MKSHEDIIVWPKVPSKYVHIVKKNCVALCFCVMKSFLFQVSGSAVLCVGVWLAVDKTSFIKLTKFTGLKEGAEAEVSFPVIIDSLIFSSVEVYKAKI